MRQPHSNATPPKLVARVLTIPRHRRCLTKMERHSTPLQAMMRKINLRTIFITKKLTTDEQITYHRYFIHSSTIVKRSDFNRDSI